MSKSQVLIAGGGVAGLVTGLLLQKHGVPFTIFEAQRRVRTLDLGVSLLPEASAILAELGIEDTELAELGAELSSWLFATDSAPELLSLPHGPSAGYPWASRCLKYSTTMDFLRSLLIQRAGEDVFKSGYKVRSFANNRDGSVTAMIMRVDARMIEATGAVLICADGLQSQMRAEMFETSPEVHWSGRVAWHGISLLDWPKGADQAVSFGSSSQTMHLAPLGASQEDGTTPVAWRLIRQTDQRRGWESSGWYRMGAPEDAIEAGPLPLHPDFDAASIIAAANRVYEVPLIDRGPLAGWTQGRAVLLGDAAHPVVPMLNDGFSLAILQAGWLVSSLVKNGLNARALTLYEKALFSTVADAQKNPATLGAEALFAAIEANPDLNKIEMKAILGEPRSALAALPEEASTFTPPAGGDALAG